MSGAILSLQLRGGRWMEGCPASALCAMSRLLKTEVSSLISNMLHTASRASCACKALGAAGSCDNKLHNALGPQHRP